MKRNFVFLVVIAIAIVSTGIINSSCMKKKMDDHATTIDMTFTPATIKKDSTVEVTFTIKDDGTLSDVTSPAWSVKSGPSTNNTLSAISKMSTGMYKGTCKFTAIGTYNMNMNCMHGDMMQNKDFSLTVE